MLKKSLYFRDTTSNTVAKDYFNNDIRVGDRVYFITETGDIDQGHIFEIISHKLYGNMILAEDNEARRYTLYKEDCVKVINGNENIEDWKNNLTNDKISF